MGLARFGIPMPLKIQSEESLRSYLIRTTLFSGDRSDIKEIVCLAKSPIHAYEAKKISAVMGWQGCRGFNNLLHKHTDYPHVGLLKSKLDSSYSQSQYLCTKKFPGQKFEQYEPYAFCPDCLREDFATRGFSFWRRRTWLTGAICVKHNVKMVRTCPFCSKDFCLNSHDLDVMWKGCDGMSLDETPSEKNEDFFLRHKPQFYADANESKYYVEFESALLVLKEKFSTRTTQCLKEENFIKFLLFKLHKAESELKADEKLRLLTTNWYASDVWSLAPYVYSKFEEFLKDVRNIEAESRTVQSLMNTYLSGTLNNWQSFDDCQDPKLAL